jgi:hypothetical protein
MSAIMLTTSKLEAILKIYRCSLKTVQRGRGVRGGQGERGERGRWETNGASNQVVKRGEGRGKQVNNILFPTAMYSTPVDLSFSYLRSAVEASLDIKKDQVDPNSYLLSYFLRCETDERK